MPRVIFKCPHIKGGTAKAAAHLGNAVGYIATRKGVQRIDPGKMNLPATENPDWSPNKDITFEKKARKIG